MAEKAARNRSIRLFWHYGPATPQVVPEECPMAKRHPRSQPVPQGGMVSVYSDLAPDGRTYIATVSLDGHTARTLDRDEAYAWAAMILAAAMQAEHDSLVFRQ